MGWKEDQQILKDLEQLKVDVASIKKSQSKLEDNEKALLNRISTLEENQKDCCQTVNSKLDQLIAALIKPPSGPAVAFNVTVEVVPQKTTLP